MYRRRNLYIQPHATQIQNIARHANNNIQQQACIGCRVASLARMLLKLTCRLPPAAPKLSLPCSVSKNTFCQWLCFLALLVLLEPVSNLCAIHLFSFHFIYFLFIYSFHTRFLLTFSCFCLCSPSQSSRMPVICFARFTVDVHLLSACRLLVHHCHNACIAFFYLLSDSSGKLCHILVASVLFLLAGLSKVGCFSICAPFFVVYSFFFAFCIFCTFCIFFSFYLFYFRLHGSCFSTLLKTLYHYPIHILSVVALHAVRASCKATAQQLQL